MDPRTAEGAGGENAIVGGVGVVGAAGLIST